MADTSTNGQSGIETNTNFINDQDEQFSSVTEILLQTNVSQLKEYLQSSPSGILLYGADRETRRTILRQISSSTQIVSSCDSSAVDFILRDDTLRTICIDDVDFPETRIEERIKGVFPVMLSRNATVIGLAARDTKVSASLRRAGRFEIQLRVSPASLEQRSDAWKSIIQTLNVSLASSSAAFTDIDTYSHHLAALSPSYQLGDFTQVVHEMLAHRSINGHSKDNEDSSRIDFETLVSRVKAHRPMQALAELSFLTTSNDTPQSDSAHDIVDHHDWGNHVGYDDVKDTLIRLIDWPVLYRAKFKRLGIGAPRGALIYGEQGCGKSLLAQAFIRRMQYANWLWVAGQDIYCKYLGESEARIRLMFDHARTLTPCVIVIDDLDVIASKRDPDHDNSTGSSGVERRVLAALLTELDGVSSGDVFVLACAADVQSLDPAIIRPGRLDVMLKINLPCRRDRSCLISHLLRDVVIAGDDQTRTGIVEMLVERLEGRSGAETEGICREAVMLAFEERGFEQDNKRIELEVRHFEQAMAEMKGS